MFVTVAQSFVSGVFTGALYGVAAAGLALVFGVMRILNIAHGELIMLGGYASYWFFSLYGIDPFLGIPLAAAVLLVVGAVLYLGLFSQITRLHDEARMKTSLLVAFGLILVFHQLAILWWTGDPRAINPSYSGSGFEILGIRFPFIPLGSAVLGLIVILALHLFLRKTYLGKSIRATAEDWEAASLMGISVGRTYLISFALGTALASVAGSLVSVTQSIHPAMGLFWTIKVLIVIVLAGMGSIGGAFVAGILIGVSESVSAIFIGSYMSLVGLAIFFSVLMFRPQGLFGKRGKEA